MCSQPADGLTPNSTTQIGEIAKEKRVNRGISRFVPSFLIGPAWSDGLTPNIDGRAMMANLKVLLLNL
jgi:hypothetical protein